MVPAVVVVEVVAVVAVAAELFDAPTDHSETEQVTQVSKYIHVHAAIAHHCQQF